MESSVTISDHTIWFKHLTDHRLRDRLEKLHDDEAINLEADGVVGRWIRMRTGKNGYRTPAIRPDGNMKAVWNEWFKQRRGENIELREIVLADDYLASGSTLFSEWNSKEDEEAFRDL
ncbi:MAG: hypothetical protein AB7I34_06130 [Rhizobiaceae bacterium]